MLPIEREIRELERFDCRGARALTLYVLTDPARDAGRNINAQLQTLLRPIWDGLADDPDALAAFQRDVDTAKAKLISLQPPPRAVALFVCTAHLLAYAVPLRFPLVPQAYWDDHLHLKPLLAQMDEHERTLVVLVDKERLRLFRTFVGNIEEVTEFVDEVPGKHRQGGYAQQKVGSHDGGWSVHMGYNSATIQRHHEQHVRKHLDRVLAAVKLAHQESSADHILLAATPEVRAELMQLLPRRWRKIIRNDLQLSLRASPAEVLAAVSALQEHEERKFEGELVTRVFELGPAHGALGAAAVAEAVANDEVLTLIYSIDLALPGHMCTECGWLMPDPSPAYCGRCSAVATQVPDLIDVFIERVLKHGGYVEEVRGAAAALLEDAGGVAAICRFASSVPTPVAAT